MQAHMVFDVDELEQIQALDAEAGELALGASTDITAEALDICGVVRKVLPILKVVQSLICFIPFTKKACGAIKKAIALLESACPA